MGKCNIGLISETENHLPLQETQLKAERGSLVIPLLSLSSYVKDDTELREIKGRTQNT